MLFAKVAQSVDKFLSESGSFKELFNLGKVSLYGESKRFFK